MDIFSSLSLPDFPSMSIVQINYKKAPDFLDGVKLGVFPGIEGIYKKESISVKDAENIIEDAENTLSMTALSDDVEEIVIE